MLEGLVRCRVLPLSQLSYLFLDQLLPYIIVDVFEVILAVSVTVILFSVVCKDRLSYHPHLIVIIRSGFILYTLTTVARIFVIIVRLSQGHADSAVLSFLPCSGPLHLATLARMALIGSFHAMAFCVAMERWMATIFLATYEHANYSWFVPALCSLEAAGGLLVFSLLYFDVILFECVVAGGIAIAVCGLMFFYACIYYNAKRYCNALIVRNVKYSLSERYQLCENVRVFTVLKELARMTVVFMFVMSFFAAMVFVGTPKMLTQAARACFNYAIHVYAFQVAAIMYRHHYHEPCRPRDLLLSVLQALPGYRPSEARLYATRTLCGERMIYTVCEQSDVYFRDFKRTWKVSENKVRDSSKGFRVC